MPKVTLDIPDDALAAIDHYARQARIPPADIMRDAIARDMRRRYRKARKVHPDERSLAPLRLLLADDFAFARDWTDLQNRLACKGYQLKECGGGLILVAADGTRAAKASELGYSYARLRRRFVSPFPYHAHSP